LVSVIAFLSLAVWLYLLFFRGMFWREQAVPHTSKPPILSRDRKGAVVAAVIPARDEQDVIARAVASLRSQHFDGNLHIFVVDDNSSDRTAEIAAASGATVIDAGLLTPGWTGKMWAQSQGVKAAAAANPDYFLFTDADIEHGPGSVQTLVDRNVALATVMVKLRCESVAERLLIPAFVFFFFKLYPPRWIADPKSSTAGAAGGCILIRSDMLQKIGGVESIRGELIDDCALAAAVKPHGLVWLGLSEETCSIRPYETFQTVWNMVARTAFTQLKHSPLLLAGTTAGMFVTYIAPPLFTFQGMPAAALAWLAMSIAYTPMLRFYRQPVILAPLLPAIASVYLGATIHSAMRYWLGAGGQWKGRVQAQRQ
jgi:hopene-associated glycosyltransferase HpnB